jgi:mannan endo-1,4-beta-mannosidase
MPFGDSITGTTCYPQLLSQKLKADNHTNFKFIGMNLNNQNCNGAPTLMTEGHGGYLVTCLTGDAGSTSCASKGSPAELTTWVAEKPDVVLMQYGTNDVWNSIPAATITGAFTKVLTAFRGMNPGVVFFVAQILPMHPNNCMDSDSSCPNPRVKTLNAAIPAWASAQSNAASPVYVVDIYSTVDDATYTPSSSNTDDGVHPNATGSDKVASKWEAALVGKSIP